MYIESLLQDNNIFYATEGYHQCQEGWVNMVCPFCTSEPGHEGVHLGYNLHDNYFYCWRCGWHPIDVTLSKLLNIPKYDVNKLKKNYGGHIIHNKIKTVKIRTKSFKFPSNIVQPTERHKKYLEKRGFDADKLINEWNLKATGPVSSLDNADYSNRIIAPISWNDKIVTFQGRSINSKHPLKYKACPKDRELIHHKSIIYGNEKLWGNIGIGMEGIFDVYKMQGPSFCTFGIEFTNKQIRTIAQLFKKVVIVFDDEIQAQNQAKKLVSELRFRGVHAHHIKIKGDVGALSQNDADYLRKQILTNKI